jgi:hypothetical protein
MTQPDLFAEPDEPRWPDGSLIGDPTQYPPTWYCSHGQLITWRLPVTCDGCRTEVPEA